MKRIKITWAGCEYPLEISDYCEFAGRMWKEVCRQSESCTGRLFS